MPLLIPELPGPYIESGVQYHSNPLSDGSGSKKKIHGGDGLDEKKAGEGYDKGCAAFLQFHEVSQVSIIGKHSLFKISPAVPLIPVP
jgi:hypothetical protein